MVRQPGPSWGLHRELAVPEAEFTGISRTPQIMSSEKALAEPSVT
jgi:hypothetical protein